MPDFLVSQIRETRHDAGDDLLSAGLGLEGLRGAEPGFADPAAPTAAELRRLAVYSNWRGICDLSRKGGFGESYGGVPFVPGREFSALARVPGARHPHRVLVHVPDAFDRQRRCLLVAPASGSRGVYGAIALAGAYGLPRGCAVAYTDKGAGTDVFDFATETGVALDGRRAARGAALAFEPGAGAAPLVAMKHAHSGDHPEADWGRHVIQAARFGLHVLARAFPALAPFTAENTVVVAAALSNGAGAVLRALEMDSDGLFRAALAAAPNVTAPDARPLYDYATEAALYQPGLLASAEAASLPSYDANALLPAMAQARCESLLQRGMVDGTDVASAAAAARERLAAAGFEAGALRQAAVNVGFDLWRSVAVTYAASYLRRPAGDMPCGFALAPLDACFRPRATSPGERAMWWATTSGIAPTVGIGILDSGFALPDPFLVGQLRLRELWTGAGEAQCALRAAVEATRATARLPDVPVLIVHGTDDGLVPPAFTSRPYVAAAREQGATRLAYWQVDRVQHFDALLGVTDLGRDHLPLMRYVWEGLGRLLAHLFDDAAPPTDLGV